jgi:hypothetical protein
VRGAPEVDQKVKEWMDATDKVWLAPSKISKNLPQKTLRDIIFKLDIIRAHCAKNLDYRNEQGRGGLAVALKKKD